MILEELEKQCNGFRDSKQFSLADIEKLFEDVTCKNCVSSRFYYFSPAECIDPNSSVEYIDNPKFFCNQFERKQ